ncbi:MAG: hypothetical protein ABFR95_02410 [Actinomycetota bacterium]
MTDTDNTTPLVAGVKSAAIHFSKAALEIASGVGVLVVGVARTVRPTDEPTESEDGGPQKIEIE